MRCVFCANCAMCILCELCDVYFVRIVRYISHTALRNRPISLPERQNDILSNLFDCYSACLPMLLIVLFPKEQLFLVKTDISRGVAETLEFGCHFLGRKIVSYDYYLLNGEETLDEAAHLEYYRVKLKKRISKDLKQKGIIDLNSLTYHQLVGKIQKMYGEVTDLAHTVGKKLENTPVSSSTIKKVLDYRVKTNTKMEEALKRIEEDRKRMIDERKIAEKIANRKLSEGFLNNVQKHLDKLKGLTKPTPRKKYEKDEKGDANAENAFNAETADDCYEDQEIQDDQFINDDAGVNDTGVKIFEEDKYILWLEELSLRGKLFKKNTRYYDLYFIEDCESTDRKSWNFSSHWSVPIVKRDSNGVHLNIHFTWCKDDTTKRIGGIKALNTYKSLFCASYGV